MQISAKFNRNFGMISDVNEADEIHLLSMDEYRNENILQ